LKWKLLTDNDQFQSIVIEEFKHHGILGIFDGRNMFNGDKIKENGIGCQSKGHS
jgi:hypothetical protein